MIPLFPMYACAVCAGIVCAVFYPLGFGIAYGACICVVALIAGSMRRVKLFIALVVALGFFCGAAAGSAVHVGRSRDPFAYRLTDSCAVRGSVADEPVFDDGRTTFSLRGVSYACGARSGPLGQTIRVVIEASVPFEYGEEIVARGLVQEIFWRQKSVRPAFSARPRAYRLSVPAQVYIERAYVNRASYWMRGLMRLRRVLYGAIQTHVRGVGGNILAAMMLGDQSLVPPLVMQDMIRSGTVHLLVISGSHVSIMTAIIIFILRMMRVPRRMRFTAAIPCLAAYVILTGASAPVVRAGIMAGVFLLAYPLRREPNIHNSWALALIILLSVNPSNLFNLGFQLSFVSVLAILYLYPYLRKACRVERLSWFFARFTVQAVLISLAVWLATAGFIAWSSRMFAPVTVVANLVLVPIAGILTVCGFTVALSSFVWPAAAAYFGAASQLLLLVMIKLNVLLLKIPCAYISW